MVPVSYLCQHCHWLFILGVEGIVLFQLLQIMKNHPDGWVAGYIMLAFLASRYMQIYKLTKGSEFKEQGWDGN